MIQGTILVFFSSASVVTTFHLKHLCFRKIYSKSLNLPSKQIFPTVPRHRLSRFCLKEVSNLDLIYSPYADRATFFADSSSQDRRLRRIRGMLKAAYIELVACSTSYEGKKPIPVSVPVIFFSDNHDLRIQIQIPILAELILSYKQENCFSSDKIKRNKNFESLNVIFFQRKPYTSPVGYIVSNR